MLQNLYQMENDDAEKTQQVTENILENLPDMEAN